MCHDWWMLRRADEAVESRRLWDEFERTKPVVEPAVTIDDANVTLRRDEVETPTSAEG